MIYNSISYFILVNNSYEVSWVDYYYDIFLQFYSLQKKLWEIFRVDLIVYQVEGVLDKDLFNFPLSQPDKLTMEQVLSVRQDIYLLSSVGNTVLLCEIEMMLVYTIILTAIGLSWAQLTEVEVKHKLN